MARALLQPPGHSWLLWLLVVAPLGFVAHEAAMWVRNIPRWDEFDTVLELVIALDAGVSARELGERLLAVQNEHRMLASRVLFVASYGIFGRVNFAALALVGNLFLVASFIVLLARTSEPHRRRRLAVVFALVVFQLQHHENFFWGGASIDHFFVVLAAVAALAALQRPGGWAVGIGCVGAMLASFSLAHGLVVWPVGAGLLLLERRWRATLCWMAAGAATLLLFLANFRVNPAHRLPGWEGLPEFFCYWLMIAGGSPALADVALAPWLGGGLVVAVLGLFWRGGRRRERLAGAVAVWCLGAMAMIAWGRAALAADWAPMTSRYLILSSMAWAMVIWIGLERALDACAARARAGRNLAWVRGARWGLPLAVSGLAVFNVAASRAHDGEGRVLARGSELAARSYHWHGTFARALTPLYPDPARADALIAEAARRGVYALPPAGALMLAQPTRVELEEPEEIDDAVYFIEQATVESAETRVGGWAFRPDHTLRQGEVAVVFRSEAEMFVFEPVPRLRPDVAEEFERWDASYAGFELRVPNAKLPPGKFSIGVCFGEGDDAEYMMTGATIVVPAGDTVARSAP